MTNFTDHLQLVIDSRDPHTLADWWAETLGWELEPTDPAFVRSMVGQGFAQESETLIHNGNLVWRIGAAIGPATADSGRRFLFQVVPEEKTVKNRLHLDLRLQPGADRDEVRAELEARGATFLWQASQGPFDWYTMADPEGNEFCFS
jgi:hypothetical protein